MKIRLIVAVSGVRNGEEWPAVGSVFELPDDEATDYIASGIVETIDDTAAAEAEAKAQAEAEAAEAEAKAQAEAEAADAEAKAAVKSAKK